jgi:HEAT repeat protein
VLAAAAADQDSTPRRAAADVLERIRSTDVALFRRLLGDSSDWVRMHAAGAVLGVTQ